MQNKTLLNLPQDTVCTIYAIKGTKAVSTESLQHTDIQFKYLKKGFLGNRR